MSRPLLLDLFCKQGGAAVGYHRAGFDVVGVDIEPQPRYPFEFYQANVMDLGPSHFVGFDVVHASPPCQAHSTVRFFQPDPSRFDEEDCLGLVRTQLRTMNLPWVIENVPGAPGPWDLLLCGTMFGLRVKRHRYFEANWALPFPPADCCHLRLLDMYSATGRGRKGTDRQYVDEIGVTWAPLENRGPAYRNGRQKLAQQAIPPAYTEWIGTQLLRHLECAA